MYQRYICFFSALNTIFFFFCLISLSAKALLHFSFLHVLYILFRLFSSSGHHITNFYQILIMSAQSEDSRTITSVIVITFLGYLFVWLVGFTAYRPLQVIQILFIHLYEMYMIFKQIGCWQQFLNHHGFICLHQVKWFLVLQSNSNCFICAQLNRLNY